MQRGILAFTLLLFASSARADWPGFRGDGSSVSGDKNLPAMISAESLLWKAKLPGLGASSPVIVGDRIFLTSYSGYGAKLTESFKGGGGFTKEKDNNADDQKRLKLWLLCLDRTKGEVAWQREIEPKLPEAPFKSFLREHGYASSTPVSDGNRLYVFFGRTGVIAFDFTGKKLWQKDVGAGTHEWGSASSPALSEQTVVVNASIESRGLVALDKITGNEKWRTTNLAICWTSPVVVNLPGGKQEFIFSAPGKISGVDPDSGTELWTCEGLGGKGGLSGSTCSTPTVQGDKVYVMSAGPSTPPTMLAVRAGGRGDVTKTHLLWKQKVGGGICSPVAAGKHVFFVDGLAYCLNADNGEVLTKERLYDARGEYASPVVADGKVYALTRFDGLFVLKAGPRMERLEHFGFEGDKSIFNSTPAVSDGRLYLRSNAFLYCFGRK